MTFRVILAALVTVAIVQGLDGTGSAAATASPLLRVLPNPSVNGAQVTAVGAGFCGTCGPVTITVDSKIVATGVSVKRDGTFEATFQRIGVTGQFTVIASQVGGPTASAGMRVVPNDRSATPTPVAPPAASSDPTPPVAASPTIGTPTSADSSKPSVSGSRSSASGLTSASPPPTAAVSSHLTVKHPANGGTAWWVWLVVGLVIVGTAGAVLAMRRRPGGSSGS